MNKKTLIALGTGLALSLASTSVALAESNGNMQANGAQPDNGTQMQTDVKKDGKCGAGKCGANKEKTDKTDGKCGANKDKTDGKCGAGKCGANKS